MNKFIWLLIVLAIVGLYFTVANNDKTILDLEDDTIVVETKDVEVNLPIIDTNPIDMGAVKNIILKTNKGDVTIELFSDKAPKTVENFIKLATEDFYDGTKFHRVISGFMIQGGDPLTKDDEKMSEWGTGGPGYSFEDEIHDANRNDVGTLAMANSGPSTNGSQFFINVSANNFLDTKHTVFGRVTEGMEVVTAIENVATEGSDRPVEAVIIEDVVIVE